MWSYVVEAILIAFHGEVEAPIAIHPRLPEAKRFVMFLGS
jgi:hypothetical protein